MRMTRLVIVLTIFFLILVAGCSETAKKNQVIISTTKNPDAEEILASDPEADIFQFDGVIYIFGIDWVEELVLTKGEQVGEIKKENITDTDFEDDMSNKLPIGTKIFSVKENDVGGPILLVESKGKILKYYGLVEG